jgi:two-component system cell cycle sensor histidine kinase/response regulator CckA
MSAVPSDLEIVRSIADDLPVAVWVARAPGGEFVYANRRFGEIMGMAARDDVALGEYAAPYGIYRRDGDLYPEDKMPFVRALQARTTVVIDDIVIHRTDGRRVNVRAFAKPMFDGAGDITHIVIAFIDITREVEAEAARAESERRLLRAQRMESVGTLAGGIAHDFNNLMLVLKLVTAQLAHAEDAERRAAAVRVITDISDRAAALTRSLLAFARRAPHASRPVSLNQVVDSMAEIVRRLIGLGIEVVIEATAAGGGVVVGDVAQLEQVVMNLVVNARDAMAGGPGQLIVRTREVLLDDPASRALGELAPGRYVCLEVIDQGPGIPPEIRDRIFEPYFTTKEQGPDRGSGLGLATVYGVVQSHQGGIAVDPGPDGRGTAMRIYLPAGARAERSEPAAPVAPGLRRGDGGTILVVDDDPLVREAIARAVADLGYRALESADGEQALAVLRAHRDDISAVLLDMVMPRMSGRAFFQALSPSERAVPVVVMTGEAETDEVQSILDLGVRGLLPKPCSIDELSIALAAAISAGSG